MVKSVSGLMMNTTFGKGNTHEVVFLNERGGGFVFFVGSLQECI